MQTITVRKAPEYIERRTGHRVTIGAIYRWIKIGMLPALRVGRRYVIRLEDLEALIYDPKKERAGELPTPDTN